MNGEERSARAAGAEEHMREIIGAAIAYIRLLFAGNADGHGFAHSMRVYGIAMRIADAEPSADRFVVSLAALLHDADDPKLFRTENNANARRFLAEQGVDPGTAERICGAVSAVSFRKNGLRRPDTPEGRIVQDADRLDALGAIGAARTFAWGGAHGRPPDESVGHFTEKLLLLRDGMNTDAAKKMAERRHAFLESFLAEWELETEEAAGIRDGGEEWEHGTGRQDGFAGSENGAGGGG